MSKNSPTPGSRAKKNPAVSLVRSSAAEYLTFVAASDQGGVEAVYADERVQAMNKGKEIYSDLAEAVVCRNFQHTAEKEDKPPNQ